MLLQITELTYRREHPIVVERQFNQKVLVRGFGQTPKQAALKIWEQRRDLGYWDATKAYPQGQNQSVTENQPGNPEEAPKRGAGRQ